MNDHAGDELATRRRARQAGDHRTRVEYDSAIDALEDCWSVVEDLRAITDDRLLATRDEVEFTARRVSSLLAASIDAVRAADRQR